jgi:hypothetical protein
MNTPSFLLPNLIMILMIALLVAISYVIPRLTRPDIYFAVTVPPDFRDSAEGRAILGRYRVELLIYGIIAIAVASSGLWIAHPSSDTLMVAGLVLQPAGGFIAYYRARQRVLPHAVRPATVREAALTPHEVPPARRVDRSSWPVGSAGGGGRVAGSPLERDPRPLPHPLGPRRPTR